MSLMVHRVETGTGKRMRSIGEGGHRDWCYDGRTDAALEMVTGMVTDILFRLLLLLSIFFMLTFLFF